MGLCSKTPGTEPEEQGRSKVKVHIFNIIYNRFRRFQVDRLKTQGQVHYTNPVRSTDERTPGQTDGRRTDTHPNSDLLPITKLVLIPIDVISVERKCTHGQGKTYMALVL